MKKWENAEIAELDLAMTLDGTKKNGTETYNRNQQKWTKGASPMEEPS